VFPQILGLSFFCQYIFFNFVILTIQPYLRNDLSFLITNHSLCLAALIAIIPLLWPLLAQEKEERQYLDYTLSGNLRENCRLTS